MYIIFDMWVSLLADELAQHVLQNAAVLEVFNLNVGIQTDLYLELLACVGTNLQNLANLQVTALKWNIVVLLAGQANRFGGPATGELGRQNAHSNKVASMNSFKALSNDNLNSLEIRTLCSPIS